jgi:(2S)-methylsuccinyl-CoA dehydrogenase
MAHDGQDPRLQAPVLLDDLLSLTEAAIAPVEGILATAKARVLDDVTVDGRVSGGKIEAHQTAAHGQAEDKFSEVEQLIHQIAFGEYLWQIYGGIPMSQGEILRLQDIGLSQEDMRGMMIPEIQTLTQTGNTQAARLRLVELMQERAAEITVGASGLDEELEMIREQFRRFAVEKVEPVAHDWHLNDELIPMEIIEELAEMGVFGLTIPEEYGGFGLSKASMCVVSEELSRGYIGVGSLGTRSEIAAELIIAGGTEEQKQKWLPKLASAETLPTAVFTEPNTGSDLGSLRTRAVKDGDDYRITGNKTWITHAARTHVMTLLARTNPDSKDHRGLSMFLAEKKPGTDEHPFPTDGMTGGEIEVLGYRGMKEYELGFDNFHVKRENLLGGEEGKGFKQPLKAPASRQPRVPSAWRNLRLISRCNTRLTASSSASR